MSARRTALDLLSRREHSAAELGRKLLAKGHEPDEVRDLIEALAREGLQSDTRYAELFTGSHARRGRGPVWIRGELERRGVAAELVARALEEADIDWFEAVRATRRKRFGAGPPKDYAERARQARFLQYRGYTADQVRAALGGDADD